MTRTLIALFASTLLIGSTALADEAGKTKTETVQPDGTKVTVKKKKDWKDDGSGEAKTEVKTENPNTGTETMKRSKVTRDKNDDGTMNQKTRTETEVKTK